MRFCLLVLTVLLLNSCLIDEYRSDTPALEFLDSSKSVTSRPVSIRLSELTENLKQYHNKYVEVKGICWFQFENVSLCPRRSYGGCYWVDYPTEFWNILHEVGDQKLSGKPAIIRGIVDISERGHMGDYKATIKNVYYVKIMK